MEMRRGTNALAVQLTELHGGRLVVGARWCVAASSCCGDRARVPVDTYDKLSITLF